MDSTSWDSLNKNQRADILKNAKLSSALAQLRWSSFTKGERKKIEGASKGKGWYEERTEEVVTNKGIEKKAPKHRDVVIKKRDKELLDKPIVPLPEKKEEAIREDKTEPEKKEVPEPTGYFTLKKAQNLTRENWSKLSDEKLHKKSIQLRDYINFIEIPDEYSRKTLVKGGYYAGVIDPDATGVVPVDMWLHQSLKYALEDLYKEQDRRKREKEAATRKEEKDQKAIEAFKKSEEELELIDNRVRLKKGIFKGKTAFRCPECFRGLTRITTGSACGEHGKINSEDILDLRKIGKDEKTTKVAKEVYEDFVDQVKESGHKSIQEFYDAIPNTPEQHTLKEYWRLAVGLEKVFGKKETRKERLPRTDKTVFQFTPQSYIEYVKQYPWGMYKISMIAGTKSTAPEQNLVYINQWMAHHNYDEKLIKQWDKEVKAEKRYTANQILDEFGVPFGLSDPAYKTFDPKHEATEDNRMKDESKREEETYEDSVITYETGDIGEMRGLAGIDEAYTLKSGEFFTEDKQKEWEAHEAKGYEEPEEPHEETYLEQLEREAENTCLIKGMRYPKKECRRVFISGIGRMHSAGVMPKKEALGFAKRYREMGHTVRVEKI